MIELDQVGVISGDITLLQPVSASAGRGESLVVRGRNGSGKSTLLRVVAGVRRPTTGTARIDGARVDSRDRAFRRRVAAMIGLPPMAPDLTVADHVALVAATWGGDADDAIGRAERLLARLELLPLRERFPHELSSGQTQLFGIALTLARPFEVLILDEPEQRLDPQRVGTVIQVLRELRDAGATLAVATHSPVLAEALADRELWLDAA